jgi:hypothetical protein
LFYYKLDGYSSYSTAFQSWSFQEEKYVLLIDTKQQHGVNEHAHMYGVHKLDVDSHAAYHGLDTYDEHQEPWKFYLVNVPIGSSIALHEAG